MESLGNAGFMLFVLVVLVLAVMFWPSGQQEKDESKARFVDQVKVGDWIKDGQGCYSLCSLGQEGGEEILRIGKSHRGNLLIKTRSPATRISNEIILTDEVDPESGDVVYHNYYDQ